MRSILERRHENDGIGGIASLAVMSIGSGAVALLLGSAYYGLPMFKAYFSSPLLVVLNLIPAVLLAFLLYFIIGRAWIAFLSSSVIIIASAMGNFYKFALRNEPFVASDIRYLGEAGGILGNYVLRVNWKIVAAVLFLIGGTVIVLLLSGKRQKSGKLRIIGGIVIIAVSALLFSKVYTSESVYNRTKSSYEINIWNENENFISRGFWYPFLYSVPAALPQKPEGYSNALGEAAMDGYEDSDIAKKVNFVSVMLEAYSDLSVYDVPAIKDSVYAPLHELYKRCAHGELVTNIFAGGTINTERAFLTGYSVQDNYRTDVESFVRYLKTQGYRCEGLHSGDGWFYNRENVNSYLGFDEYYFLEDYENGNRTDSFFFGELKRMFEERDTSTPYFNFSVTYQNHGSYSAEWTAPESYLEKGVYSEATYNILNNYLSGIADTTERIAELADYFESRNEPVVLIIFGDHKPWLGDSGSIYGELGIDIEMSSDEGFFNRYSTPYIIFANSAAKKVLNNDFTGYLGSFSPCYLMTEVFDLCSYEGSGYMKLLRELKSDMDVMSTAADRFRVDGKFTSALDGDMLTKYNRFSYAEYYMRHRSLN